MSYNIEKGNDKDYVSISTKSWLHIGRKKIEEYFRELTDDEWRIITEKVDYWVPETPEDWTYRFDSYVRNDNGYNELEENLNRILKSEVK